MSNPGSSFVVLRASSADALLAKHALEAVSGRAPVDEAALRRFLSDPEKYLLFALEDRLAIGVLSGHALRHPHRPEPQFLLYEVDVAPTHRNRGVATELVRRFSEEARTAGASEVWVLANASNSAAMALYAKCGFRRENADDVMWTLPFQSPV